MRTWSTTMGMALLGLTSMATAQQPGLPAPTLPAPGQVQVQVQVPAVPVIPRPAGTQTAPATPAAVVPGRAVAPATTVPAQAAPGRPVAVQAGAAAAPAQAVPADQAASAAAVAERLAGFVKAFNDRNATALADYLTEDATLIASDGVVTRGKPALGELFTAGFAQPTNYTLASTIEGTRFLTPDVAQLEGVSKLTAPNEPSVVNNFVSLVTRTNTVWRIAEIRDLPAAPEVVAPADRLAELEWMVGDWVSESAEANTKTTSSMRWGDNKAFLVRQASEQVGQEKPHTSLMIVGWDPQSSQIKSWLFDSEGTVGEGLWARAADNQWVIRAQGAHIDGTSGSATQVITLENPNAARTSTVDRMSGGVIGPDKDEILMVRRPPASPAAAPGAAAPAR